MTTLLDKVNLVVRCARIGALLPLRSVSPLRKS
jgi:hypothetical protein